MFHSLPTAVDVFVVGACQPANRRLFCVLRNLCNSSKVAFGCDWKTGFDNIDAHFIEHLRDFQLFLVRHCCAGRLFAVAQRRVKNQYLVGHFLVSLAFVIFGAGPL